MTQHSTTAPRARPSRVVALTRYRQLTPLQWRKARGLMTWMDYALEYRRLEVQR